MTGKDMPRPDNHKNRPSGVVKDKDMDKIMARFTIPGHAVLYADSLNKAVNRERYEAVESKVVVK